MSAGVVLTWQPVVKLPKAHVVVSPGLGRGGVSWTPQAAPAGRGQGAALGYLPLMLGPSSILPEFCCGFGAAASDLPFPLTCSEI